MKLILVILLSVFSISGFAQNLDAGFRLFENGDYKRALKVFEASDLPEAHLFSGKSHFNLGNSLRAIHYFNKIESSVDFNIYQDALYSKALAHFDLKNYTSALESLFTLSKVVPRSPLVIEGRELYSDLLEFMTLNEKQRVFYEIHEQQIRFDLLKATVGKVDYGTARTFLDLFKQTSSDTNFSELRDIERALSDSVSYSLSYNPGNYPQPPEGIIYRIGVVLPSFDPDLQGYEVSQSLYFGIQYAVEQFNTNNSDKKIFLFYKDSGADAQRADDVMADLIWRHRIDAVIGPLISETAQQYAALSEQYETPLLAPLANSDSVNFANNYAFQLNPTFAIRGKEMARFAVNKLGLDTLAILAEDNALGTASAIEFRHEAERLGAHIAYNFVQNLESEGYAITEYTQIFTKDSVLIDSLNITPVKGIYAPFTGDAASTLIESLLTDIEAMESEVTILGSEEWEAVEIENRRLENNSIYYTKIFEIDEENKDVQQFREAYINRFNIEPTDFSYIGYDTANLLLATIEQVGNADYLKNALRNLKNFKGLSITYNFAGSNINSFSRIKRLNIQDF